MRGFLNPFFSLFKLHFNVLLILQICCIVSLNAQDIDAGASLYKANCTSCHYMGPYEKKLIGPGLNAEILEKYSREWLYDWIRNSSELIESGDKQAGQRRQSGVKRVTSRRHTGDEQATKRD